MASRRILAGLVIAALVSAGRSASARDAELEPEWRVLAPSPLPALRRLPTAAFWTGREMLVLGVRDAALVAAAYAPEADSIR